MFDATKVLIPFPKKIEDKKKDVVIGVTNNPYYVLEANGEGFVFEEAIKLFRTKMTECALIDGDSGLPSYKIVLNLTEAGGDIAGKSEAYTLHIDSQAAIVTAGDEAGIFYGVTTLVSLIHMDGDNVCLPILDIVDYPDFKERGQYMECRYGSDFLTLDDYKKAVDYFASIKQNTLTIGLYGCWAVQYDKKRAEYLYIPFKKYPQLKTPRDIKYYSVNERKWIYRKDVLPEMFEKDYFAELVEYGLKKNVTIRPFFNSLGHNTLLPRMFPEISAKDEDGTPRSYGFCTNNEDTYKLMFDLYDEIIDSYMKPYGIDSIHIGLDEVWETKGLYEHDMAKSVSPYCQCEKCRGIEHTELIINYMIKLCKYLKSRGMKSVYVFHDMLFNNGDFINEDLKQRFIKEDIYDVVVFDWWGYRRAEDQVFHGNFSKINSIFRSVIKPITGYYHWLFPSQVNDNIKILTKRAKELGYEGVGAYSSLDECYDKNYKYCADLSWNADTADDEDGFESRYINSVFGSDADEVAKIMPAMNDLMFSDCGSYGVMRTLSYYFYGYFDPNKVYPSNYPGEAFATIKANYDEFTQEYKKRYDYAVKALDVLDSISPSHMCDVWRLIATQYKVVIDVFLSLIDLEAKCNDASVEEKEIVTEIKRLIKDMEKLMKMAEDVRIKANQYIFIRNLEILRLSLVDLLRYVQTEIAEGRYPKFDVCDMSSMRCGASKFLA